MRLVLGIDAAWTEKNPSGVALVEEIDSNKWKLSAVSSSYGGFCRKANAEGDALASNVLDATSILRACEAKAGRRPDLIAVDMPMSKSVIEKRRVSDDCISAEFARFWCGTHSPNKIRPGQVGLQLYKEFCNNGYAHWVNSGEQETRRLPGLIEVYPHPALLALIPLDERLKAFGNNKRLPYKIARVREYFEKIAEPPKRRQKLAESWQHIVTAMERVISGVSEKLGKIPPYEVLRGWKAYEDKLDAVVCAYVAIRALDGAATAYGDGCSAIWVPNLASLR